MVVPDKENAKVWATKKGIAFDYAELCKNDDFKKDLFDDLMQLAAKNKLSSLEKPKEIMLLPDEFSVENDLLTPTFKLKRNVCAKVFEKEIASLYEIIDAAEAKRSTRAWAAMVSINFWFLSLDSICSDTNFDSVQCYKLAKVF